MADKPATSGSKVEIILHLGAHKTATTYIQRSLSLSAAALAEKGVFIVPTVDFRRTIDQVRTQSDFLNRFARIRKWRVSRVYQNYLRQAEAGRSGRLVISEEGLLGSINHLTNDGMFYEKISRNLKIPITGLKARPVTAILAIRSYDSFFTSAWGQTVKEFGYRQFDETQKSRLMGMKRGWFDVIGDILELLPLGSRLRVYRFEDFKNNENPAFSELVGAENTGCITRPKKNMLPGLSKQAIVRLDNLNLRGEPTTREVVLQISKRYPKAKGFATFSPWNEAEKKILVDRYEADTARIRAQWPDLMVG